MMNMKPFSDVEEFHGHACVGLALGYRVAEYAAQVLDLTFSHDEEVVAITETDSCTVDAIQVILGCTAGKGNLFINKWGKNAFTFWRRDKNTSVRFVGNADALPMRPKMNELRPKVFGGTATPKEAEEFHRLSDEMVNDVLSMPLDRLFTIKEATLPIPEKARIFNTVACSVCGEPVADGLAVQKDGKYICVPCTQR